MKNSNLRPPIIRIGLSIGLVWVAAVLQINFQPNAAAADQTSIFLLEAVEVDSATLYLGKIARIDGPDPQLIQQLNDVVIAKAPLAGRDRIIEAGYVELRLRQNGFDIATLALQGSPHVRATRSYTDISKAEIEKIVSDYLYHATLKENPAANLKDLRVPEHVILPKGHISYQVVGPQKTEFLGKIPIVVQFYVNGKLQKKVWTTVTIEMLVNVVVAKNPLRRHKPIDEDDIELQLMDLAELPRNVITDPQELIGKRTRQSIGSKTVLRTDLIELPPLINRGDVVVIIAESEGLRITALGKAKRRGRLGERIPVENFDSKKVLHALVIDSRTVKVEL